MNEDRQFKAMFLLDDKPEMTQRELARALDISLGAANFCVKALADKGWIKMANLKKIPESLATYIY